MKNIVRLSVVNFKCNKLPVEANPYLGKFDIEARKKYASDNMERMYAFMHEAGKSGTDLVCTCEDYSMSIDIFARYIDDMNIHISLGEEIPGPVTERMGEIAKQHAMHIAANLYEKEGNKLYNTTVLIGRDGKIIGKYRKIHLPVVEKWMVTPGSEYSVFDTDIGRIGFAVCYDIVFSEHCNAMALQGADIILHPTGGWGFSGAAGSYMGEALLRVRAAENAVFMAAAMNDTHNSTGRSCVIGNNGSILAETGQNIEGIATAEFSVNYDVVREDLFDTFFSGVSSARARHNIERRPELYSVITEKRPALRERYKNLELMTEAERIKQVATQWKEYVEATTEKRPPNLDYKWL